MNAARSLLALLCVAAAGCSGQSDAPAAPATSSQASVAAAAPVPAPQAAVVPVAAAAGDLPNCGAARVQDLVKEAFIRRALVEGDHALIERGTLEPADAFAEQEMVKGMPRMLALARLDGVSEVAHPSPSLRRCAARLVVTGWDMAPPVTYQITALTDGSQFGVESHVQLLPGAEGFNMVQGYRSTFGRALRP